MRRRISLSGLVVASSVALLCAGAGSAADTTTNTMKFDDVIHINKDASLDVKETIIVDYKTQRHHGIFRTIPYRYAGRNGVAFNTNLIVKDVKEDDVDAHYTTRKEEDDVMIKIGDPSISLNGVHTYEIHYIVRRAINFIDGRPELYWNVVGHKWPFHIDRAQAEIYLPAGTDVLGTVVKSFRGNEGSTQKAEIWKVTDGLAYQADNLQPNQGLTVVASLPPGSVTEPPPFQELLWFLVDWWPSYLIPTFTGMALFLLWWQGGRDADGGKPIAVDWNPPKDLTPAEVGTLVDEKCDMQDVIAIMLDLASRGYLKIREVQKNGNWFSASKGYEFIKNEPPPKDNLSDFERTFLTGMFGNAGAGSVVRLSDLKEKFYEHIPRIKSSVYQSLMNKRMFQQNPQNVRVGYYTIAGAMAALGFFLLLSTHLPSGFGFIFGGLFVALMASAMPAKTAAGSQAARESLGFARFVKMAEKDRIRVLAKDDPTIFGRLLPYAMVLGAADQWAEAFRDIMTKPPDWYEPYGYYDPGYSFSTNSFVHDLGGGLRTMEHTMTSTPASASSGGSGMSGGFSGGGFGGGGGGTW